jgi:ketosteroid isomerase-like protein
MSRTTRAVLGLVVLIVGVIVGLKAIIETDEEAIERVTNACRAAFLERNVDGILANLTADAVFRDGNRNRSLADEAGARVEQVGRRVESISLNLREIEIDGDDARALWRVNVRLRRKGQGVPFGRFDLRAEYRRESEVWKIRHVEIIGI